MVLLHVMAALASNPQQPFRLFAFHVHHGISPNADRWLAFCEAACTALGVTFDAHRVVLDRAGGESLEALARERRYTALGAMCRQHGVLALLTAHHQDDQIETLLLQLFRGAGVDGLAAMGPQRHLQGIALLRPWLSITRELLAAAAMKHGIQWVDDESNDDQRFARNALRQQLPSFASVSPGYRTGIARSATHLAEASAVLEEVAAADLAAIARGAGNISLERLVGLSPARRKLVLRYWIEQRTGRPPSAAWLAELGAQLFDAGPEAQVTVRLPGWAVHRYRDIATLTRDRGEPPRHPMSGTWSGELQVHVQPWHGSLVFTPDPQGFPETLLRLPLELLPRQGGERIACVPGGPRRPLKQAWQSAGIPPWQRPFLPLIWQSGRLLFVAGIGINHRVVDELGLSPGDTLNRWRIDWVRDPD